MSLQDLFRSGLAKDARCYIAHKQGWGATSSIMDPGF